MKYKLKPGAKLRIFGSYHGLAPLAYHALNSGQAVELTEYEAKELKKYIDPVKKKGAKNGD